jgi:hypothetical protein
MLEGYKEIQARLRVISYAWLWRLETRYTW